MINSHPGAKQFRAVNRVRRVRATEPSGASEQRMPTGERPIVTASHGPEPEPELSRTQAGSGAPTCCLRWSGESTDRQTKAWVNSWSRGNKKEQVKARRITKLRVASRCIIVAREQAVALAPRPPPLSLLGRGSSIHGASGRDVFAGIDTIELEDAPQR